MKNVSRYIKPIDYESGEPQSSIHNPAVVFSEDNNWEIRGYGPSILFIFYFIIIVLVGIPNIFLLLTPFNFNDYNLIGLIIILILIIFFIYILSISIKNHGETYISEIIMLSERNFDADLIQILSLEEPNRQSIEFYIDSSVDYLIGNNMICSVYYVENLKLKVNSRYKIIFDQQSIKFSFKNRANGYLKLPFLPKKLIIREN